MRSFAVLYKGEYSILECGKAPYYKILKYRKYDKGVGIIDGFSVF